MKVPSGAWGGRERLSGVGWRGLYASGWDRVGASGLFFLAFCVGHGRDGPALGTLELEGNAEEEEVLGVAAAEACRYAAR